MSASKPVRSDIRMNKTVMSRTTLSDLNDREDVAYWRTRPPEERMAALEHLRQIFYNYDPTTARLSGFLEIVEPS